MPASSASWAQSTSWLSRLPNTQPPPWANTRAGSLASAAAEVGPIDPHRQRAGGTGNGAVDHLHARRQRALGAGAQRQIELARRLGAERVPRRAVGRRHQVEQALRFGIECHSSNSIHRQTPHSSSPRPCFVTRRMLRCAMTFEPDHGASHTAAPSWWRRGWDRVRAFRPGPSKAAAPSTGRRRLWRWGCVGHPGRGRALLSGGRADRREYRRRSAVRTAQRGAGRKPGGRHGGASSSPARSISTPGRR